MRGAHGLAGEVGLLSAAAEGQAASPATALARLGFGRPDAPSLDVPAVPATLDDARAGGASGGEATRRISEILAHAVVATCAVADPERVLLGDPIGSHPALLERWGAPAPMRLASPGENDAPVACAS